MDFGEAYHFVFSDDVQPLPKTQEEAEDEGHYVEELVCDHLGEYITPYEDLHFAETFSEGSQEFVDLDEVSDKIAKYEMENNVKLKICKSNASIGSRLYTCVSHTECKFRARFGPRRGDKQLVLKSFYLYHSGQDRNGTYNCGRKFKHPITHTITPVIEKVQSVKSANPVAQDIVKATKALEGKQSTYPQAHKVLLKKKAADNLDGKASYQLLIPYIDEFVKLNPGTTSSYERNEKNNITKIFLCPGIMNNKLRHVRPVLSFDAAHRLSSDIKG